MFRYLKDIIFATRYNHYDKEVGLLRRVAGFWRVENQDVEIGVTIKIVGSDRFGPNKNALISYKKYRKSICRLWEESQEAMKSELEQKSFGWPASESIFHLSEIIVNNIKDCDNDIVFAFQIEQDDCSLYSVLIKEGKVSSYERVSYK